MINNDWADLELEPGADHMSDEPYPHYCIRKSIYVSIKWNESVFRLKLITYEGDPSWPIWDEGDELASQIAMDINTQQTDFLTYCLGSPESPGLRYNRLAESWGELKVVSTKVSDE